MSPSARASHRHVVLVTYGEPPRPSFVAQLHYSWRILVGLTRTMARLPAAVLPYLALARASSRVGSWRRERFQSPLEPITHAQAEGLAAALAAAAPGVGWSVHVAYEFRDPLLQEVIASLPTDEPVDVVPMYAADSAFTHQLARDVIARLPGVAQRSAPIRVLPPLPTATLADLGASHVRSELLRREFGPAKDTALVLAAHGTLLQPLHPYETGRTATEHLAQEIAQRLEGESIGRHAGARRRLDQLEPGERSIIQRLDGNSALERRLMELGLVPGTAVEVVRRAPFGDPVEIRIRDVSLALRRSETSRIHVAPR